MAYYNRSKINELVEEPDEEFVIGEFQFDGTLNEDTVGYPNISGIIKMCVYNKEGQNIPHFHLVRSNGPDICIMLTDNRYFNHGKNSGMLSSHKECKKLNEWLKLRPAYAYVESYWKLAVEIWNTANRDKIIDTDHATQPNYSTIKPYK